MPKICQLMDEAERYLDSDQPLKALHILAYIVDHQPENLDARLRIADALLAARKVQEAASIYTAIARHTVHAAYPLRAIICIKTLSALEPQFAPLLRKVAELYAVESERLGRSARVSLGDPNEEVAAVPIRKPGRTSAELITRALEVARTIEGSAALLAEKLPPIPLLSELSAPAFSRLLEASCLVRKTSGAVIMRQGDPGHSFFMIARGTVEVLHEAEEGQERSLAFLGPGSIFGEMALVSASPRGATVRTVTSADFLEFDKSALAAASSEMSTIAAALDAFMQRRLLSNLLSTAPLFAPLDREQRLALIRHFRALTLTSDTLVLAEGSEARGLFVVLRGEVEVSKNRGNERTALATLQAGEVFGEIAMLTGQPVSASVRTTMQTTLLFLERPDFQKLVAGIEGIRDYVENLSHDRAEKNANVVGPDFDTELDDDLAIREAPSVPPPAPDA